MIEMETKKMKRSSEPRDRLSELPDSLIFNIFEFLPMNDVFTTRFLSHRWKNLWTITPYLNFHNESENLNAFRNFVSRALLRWRGEKILKFSVKSETLDPSLFNDLDLWLLFAVDNGVEELRTSFTIVAHVPNNDNYYRVPECLFSCSSLQNLSIFVSRMEINGNVVQWNQLKSLEIRCFRITQHAIDLILSKCPLLEVFILAVNDNLSLSFRSASLKRLRVHKSRRNVDISMNTELRIWTPNLETLTISGAAYGKCLLMDVSSLTHANLLFIKNDHIGETLSKILPTIRHVEGLTLSDCCIKVLGDMIGCSVLSPFPIVTFLSLDIGSFEEHDQIVGLLECCPKLRTLVVQEEATNIAPKCKKKKFKPNPSESFLEELRIVKFTWRMRDRWIFPLIKILLKYASKLEKMVIRVKPNTPPFGSLDSLLFASQSQTKLLRMPRSSPIAKLIFCEE